MKANEKTQNRLKLPVRIILFVLIGVALVLFIRFLPLVPFLAFESLWMFGSHEINTDIDDYGRYRSGEAAKEHFRSRLDMDESIWPEEIKDTWNVRDYYIEYYNPWDAEYAGYLVVDFCPEDYAAEIRRLSEYQSTEYRGIFGMEYFRDYSVAAMNVDEDQGVIYALTDGEKTISYVEIVFAGYCGIDYAEKIPSEYLPVGFDATKKWALPNTFAQIPETLELESQPIKQKLYSKRLDLRYNYLDVHWKEGGVKSAFGLTSKSFLCVDGYYHCFAAKCSVENVPGSFYFVFRGMDLTNILYVTGFRSAEELERIRVGDGFDFVQAIDDSTRLQLEKNSMHDHSQYLTPDGVYTVTWSDDESIENKTVVSVEFTENHILGALYKKETAKQSKAA